MQILSGLCGKLFVFKAKLKNENQKMIGWHAGCKRKGRGGGAKFPQREFARDGQSQTATIHSHKSAAHRGRTTDLRQRGFICSPAVWFLLRQETAGLKPVFLCGHGWPCGTPAPDGKSGYLVVYQFGTIALAVVVRPSDNIYPCGPYRGIDRYFAAAFIEFIVDRFA